MQQILWKKLSHAVLFDCELAGQISDGHWENARPNNHYRWAGAYVMHDPNLSQGLQILEPEHYINRRYNFAAKDLFDVVGDRMLAYVRLGMLKGFDVAQYGEDLANIQDILILAHQDELSKESSYWIKKVQAIKRALNIPQDTDAVEFKKLVHAVLAEMTNVAYSVKDLKADLKEMSELVNNYSYR